MGWERSILGYPTTDEEDAPEGGRISRFQGGSIAWNKVDGAFLSKDVIHHHADVSTSDWLPVGGWLDLVVNKQGDFTFAGHLHNSGFPNIQIALAAVLMTPSGIGYGFGREHSLDGTVTILGRNRDDDWIETRANPQLAGNWGQVVQGQLHWQIVAHDTLSRGIQGLIEDLAKEAATQIGKAGIAAIILLI